MPDAIVIGTNVPEVIRDLGRVAREQLPFATSLALNNVAKLAREDVRTHIDREFIVRSSTFTRNAVTMKASSKRHLQSELGIRFGFLARHEEGGVFSGQKRKAIPAAIRKSKRQRVGRARWPGRELQKPRRFIRRLPSGAISVVQRMARGGRLRVLWTLVPRVKIEPRLKFEETARRTVSANWEKEFRRALARAIATAR